MKESRAIVILYTGGELSKSAIQTIQRNIAIDAVAQGKVIAVAELTQGEIAQTIADKAAEIAKKFARNQENDEIPGRLIGLKTAIEIIHKEMSKIENPNDITAAIFLSKRSNESDAVNAAVKVLANADEKDLEYLAHHRYSLPEHIIAFAKVMH